MSPLRRRKSAASRARARRRELVERERLTYQRERAGERPEEAREAPRPSRKRPRRRRRARPGLGGLRSASTSGARATVRQIGPGIGRLLGSVGGAFGWLIARLLRLAALVERTLLASFDTIAEYGERTLALAQRRATPERVLVVVIGAAAGCLVYSQFVTYRGVEVGQPQYSEVSAIAPAPQTDPIDAGAAHAYVLIPLAALALAIALAALLTGRWRLARLVSVIGLLGVAISLTIDLPQGLDAGTAGTAFAGANATLTEGFYAQLAASAVLALCGWVLAANLRPGIDTAERRRGLRRRQPRPRRAPSVAGGL